MKRITIPALIVLASALTSSCNKEYTCVCKNSTWHSEDPIKSFSRREAALRCENDSEEFGRPDRVVCQLK